MSLAATREQFLKFKQSGRLPSPKGVALALINMTQNDQANIDDLIRLIKSDPALSGRILKFANSAGAGSGRQIVALSQATMFLGLFRVRQLVITFQLVEQYKAGLCPQFDYSQFWTTSLLTGLAAQELASFAQSPAEECFTCGLLSGVGSLALATLFPKNYGELLQQKADEGELLQLEQKHFGLDHSQLTMDMLLDWGLPSIFAEAVCFHELPLQVPFATGSRAYSLTYVLHFARQLAVALNADHKNRWDSVPNLYQTAAQVGLDTQELSNLAVKVASRWEDWGRELQLPICPLGDFKDMLALTKDEQSSSIWSDPVRSLALIPLKVLVLSEKIDTLHSLTILLRELGQDAYTAKDEEHALKILTEHRPEILLIEIANPSDPSCLAGVCATLGRFSAFGVYCIAILPTSDERYLQALLKMGMDDYLFQPLTHTMLLLRMQNAQRVVVLQSTVRLDRESLIRSTQEWAFTKKRLLTEALRDPLTELLNRRYGLDRLQQEWDFCASSAQPLSLLMVDIDYFKQVNDVYGHDVGDQVLRALAQSLNEQCRKNDVIFRYGGEEFVVICPITGLNEALQLAERIVVLIKSRSFSQIAKSLHLSVSIGVAASAPDVNCMDDLIKLADKSLYAAKNAGRNQSIALQSAN